MGEDWLTVGANVAVVRWNTWGGSFYEETVERVTKTQAVLKDGRRFRLKDLREVGSDWWSSTRLDAIDSEAVKRIRREAELSASISSVWAAVDALRNERTPARAEALRDAAQKAADTMRATS